MPYHDSSCMKIASWQTVRTETDSSRMGTVPVSGQTVSDSSAGQAAQQKSLDDVLVGCVRCLVES